ncbi:T. brucei spp.-specific protein [Trypanosoma brucei gambiense DAL972]|uniref:T. brucei spp.-specific protein n=1 Tax=Trypanosoma brucei gambiense (strain MHOM/CI/86/DAL972) TaxID=679716 RepID=C9ZV62_TRYB9|nr:T. brucei spp.-specific protein [Trypanosoma brucei gambiense DAL972]CBH13300.1 T. brucei spp.-specific protein [Trypanosoma brucei gambiense DAL972]|eukprot:XP_011775577.1 T. brucei spp.-specific protein [Trypanosoma brucei gambiense DAL972]
MYTASPFSFAVPLRSQAANLSSKVVTPFHLSAGRVCSKAFPQRAVGPSPRQNRHIRHRHFPVPLVPEQLRHAVGTACATGSRRRVPLSGHFIVLNPEVTGNKPCRRARAPVDELLLATCAVCVANSAHTGAAPEAWNEGHGVNERRKPNFLSCSPPFFFGGSPNVTSVATFSPC